MVEQVNIMDDEGSKQTKTIHTGSDDSDVSEPIRLRCPFLYGVEGDRFLCDYNKYFLPIVGAIIWTIFLFS
jgi:hypothetical protein